MMKVSPKPYVMSAVLAAASAALAMGCAAQAPTELEAPADDDRVHRRVTDPETGAEHDVEVRWAGGPTREDAEALLARIEVRPARELFPGVELPAVDPSADGAGELDASEPTFEVVLRPLNDAAARERFAWRVPLEQDAPDAGSVGADGVGTVRQAVSANVAVGVALKAGERWQTARQYCHAFVFAADVAGLSKVCIDLGAKGVAGSICRSAFDPRDPVVVAHPGGNLNPFDKHYFRGSVTATSLFGQGGAFVAFAGYACL